jgi:hypothetical protein
MISYLSCLFRLYLQVYHPHHLIPPKVNHLPRNALALPWLEGEGDGAKHLLEGQAYADHLHLARHALLDQERVPHAQAASLCTYRLLLHILVIILHLYTETDDFREPFWTFGSLSKGLTF